MDLAGNTLCVIFKFLAETKIKNISPKIEIRKFIVYLYKKNQKVKNTAQNNL